ncbi:MAG: ribonuclease HII [Candidatus Brennerbacteria bacterium]|nr:ribonuclease HII [Candidatus Brennerbacteria bacterium]
MPKNKFIVGIDEVGRGPLAGPILVAAVLCPSGFRPRCRALPLRDSKKLTVIQKQGWFGYIGAHPKISFATARVYPRGIDRLNVARAANRAATRAFLKLVGRGWVVGGRTNVYLDGGLYLQPTTYNLKPKTLVRGDEKINAIKLASIIAKVTRDRYMTKLHKRYPNYGFDEHKGYGTKKHKRALKKHGPTKFHRLTFI